MDLERNLKVELTVLSNFLDLGMEDCGRREVEKNTAVF